ncbi:MAG TPA: glycoside hydrolase family 3 C-terminal domain-containing protein [Longimicrobiaceae bacterium]|nr:glycoside hydrolase family 3 C-terminal domain-containing protein [Longimicrobiaceae bacterium]
MTSPRQLLIASRYLLSLPAAFLCVVAARSPLAGQAPAAAPYLDPALPLAQRVGDLISRMTLDEKVSQLVNDAPAIPRLEVPAYNWWNEAAHGVANAGYATNFPETIGLGATWDTALIHRIGATISTEGRAKYHEAVRTGQKQTWFYGLTFWAPNINIFRDPRWGRGQETFGEDPFLTGRLAVSFVEGMQGDDPKYLKVVSTPKHFAVHSGPEPERHRFNVDVSPHDLEDTYLPAFRAAVTEGHAQSVMCAYNAIDGAPACANTMLLAQHLRGDWGFDGYVVSDCGAVNDVATGHHFAPDLEHAGAVSLKAGTDLECGSGGFPKLAAAVKEGLVSEAQIDTALTRLFTARFRLGMFDPPSSYAYGRIPFSENNSPAHRQLALQAAREAMVLLKNDGVLPLAAGRKRIAVIGPTAELVQALQGNYNGTPPRPVSPIEGIRKRFGAANVVSAQGSLLAEDFAVPVERSALRSGGGEGLKGEYFANPDLRGRPVAVRIDPSINFNWAGAAPVEGLSRDSFSVRWTGTLTPPAPGDYTLAARVSRWGSQSAVQLYLDGKLVLDSTRATQGRRSPVQETVVHFADTKPREVRLEYRYHGGNAGLDLTWLPPAGALRAEAVAAAKQADVVVAVLGLSPQLEGEEMPVHLEGFDGGDRTDIRLPRPQRDLLAALRATGKPVVLVLTNGSALAVDSTKADAILDAWYPGEAGGTAIAETLAGDNNPAGRLPVTFYASVDQLPPFEDYSMANRTYRYFTGTPWRGFGYGLSYSRFAYSGLDLPAGPVAAGDSVLVGVDVKNVSDRAGDEVVELYLTQPKQALTPIRELAGFSRVHLAPGQTVHVTLPVSARALGQVDARGNRVVVPGEYRVFVGGAQPGDTRGGVRGSFTVSGPARTLPR